MSPLRMLAAGVLVAAAAACGSGADPTAPATLDLEYEQMTYGMNLKLSEEGVLKADLHADTAMGVPGSGITQLRVVRLTFFDENGERSGALTSRTGQYDQESGGMVARGDVVLVIEGNADQAARTILTEELHYDQRGDRVWSDLPTSIEQKGQTLYTDGFNSDSGFTEVRGRNARTSGVEVGEGGIRF
jgi:LPS export ABC transporter protein LptC